ncbi:MAG: nucleotidyltransferase domain-containing protein [Cyanobium sp.]
MPVRSWTRSRLRCPAASAVLQAVQRWAGKPALSHPDLQRLGGVRGDCGRGDACFVSALDPVSIDAAASGPQSRRDRPWPFETLPLSGEALVLTPGECQELMDRGLEDSSRCAFARALQRDCGWVRRREGSAPA